MILLFVAHLHANGSARASIVSIISAVAYFHKVNGFRDPTGNFIVGRLLAGAWQLGTVTDVRLPVTLPVLIRLVQAIPTVFSSHYRRIVLRAMMVLAFRTYLRVGYMVPRSKSTTQGCVKSGRCFHYQWPYQCVLPPCQAQCPSRPTMCTSERWLFAWITHLPSIFVGENLFRPVTQSQVFCLHIQMGGLCCVMNLNPSNNSSMFVVTSLLLLRVTVFVLVLLLQRSWEASLMCKPEWHADGLRMHCGNILELHKFRPYSLTVTIMR